MPQQPDRQIQPSDLVVHMQSNKVYMVAETDYRPHPMYPDTPVLRRIILVRLGDQFVVHLGAENFITKYRTVTEGEDRYIASQLEDIDRRGIPFSADEVPQSEGGTGPEEEEERVTFLVEPDERHDFDRIICHEDVKKQIEVGLNKIKMASFLNDEWNLKSVEPFNGKCAINFYGEPGTGKTLSALATARLLNKKLVQTDYSQIVSKYVGDTAKHIKQAFAEAKEQDAILFFDEADSMLSRRISMADQQNASFMNSVNQNRNVLMQEIDKHDGIIIFATNFFENFDPAMLRRIAQHVEFKLPDEEMRKKLLRLHVPEEVPLNEDVDFDELARETDKLSGGDIKNVCINSIVSACMEDPQELTQTLLLDEIKRTKEAKAKHTKEKKKGSGYRSTKIGFMPREELIE